MASSFAALPLWQSLRSRPRLYLTLVLSCALYFCLPEQNRLATRLLISWNGGAAFYVLSVAIMIFGSTHDDIKQRAAAQDENGVIILVLTVFGAVASIGAIMHELVTAKNLAGAAQGHAILLAACTVLLSWFFMQTIFALHYAHAYYDPDVGDEGGGLEFPAKLTTPDYWDFVYFSFIIGTAAQTADINITSRVIRRIVTMQCVTVFFFNTTILALAINVGAGLTQ